MNGIHSVNSTNLLLKQSQNVEKLDSKNLKKDEELREASREFEQLFVQQMLDSMRQSVPESELVEKSQGEKIFRSMLDQEYARIASKTDSFGLGEMIYQEYKPNLGR